VQPETTYARLGEDRIAYQVLGEGPDLVLTMGAFGHVDLQWEDPGTALFLRRLASFSRLILFDRRGTGASDPFPEDMPPPWEAYAEEVAAVMDAAGSRRAALMATTAEAGPMALFFAATRPERTSALVLGNASARYVADDDYPIGIPPERAEAIISRVEDTWGTAEPVTTAIPSRAGDERFRRWVARMQRSMASPRTVHVFLRALFEVDVRPLLPLVQAPTLVLHRRDFALLPIEHGRYLAEHLPDARLVILPGADGPLTWEEPEVTLGHIEEFLTGVRQPVPSTRVLATVLFTDIVASTERAAELGDRRWRELLGVHDDLGRRLVEQWGGRWSRRPATGSWPPSTARAGPSAARSPSATSSSASTSRSAPGSTPARSSCAATTSAASPSTSPPGSWPRPTLGRCSCPGPSATWSPALASPWPTAAPASSRASRAPGSCSR
jgi:pimeloyl-ACP methyl ester carboxylesterase